MLLQYHSYKAVSSAILPEQSIIFLIAISVRAKFATRSGLYFILLSSVNFLFAIKYVDELQDLASMLLAQFVAHAVNPCRTELASQNAGLASFVCVDHSCHHSTGHDVHISFNPLVVVSSEAKALHLEFKVRVF